MIAEVATRGLDVMHFLCVMAYITVGVTCIMGHITDAKREILKAIAEKKGEKP